MSIAKEFREFAVKGNVMDLAVGVIIGAAFGKIVGSLVEDVVMPVLESAAGPDEGLCEQVLRIAAARGTGVALDYLGTQGSSARGRATILARLARAEPDPVRAYSLWLDALIESRSAGRAALRAVITEGEDILSRAATGETSASLVARIDAEFRG